MQSAAKASICQHLSLRGVQVQCSEHDTGIMAGIMGRIRTRRRCPLSAWTSSTYLGSKPQQVLHGGALLSPGRPACPAMPCVWRSPMELRSIQFASGRSYYSPGNACILDWAKIWVWFVSLKFSFDTSHLRSACQVSSLSTRQMFLT